MTVHFYAFGSICRGEVDRSSDIDLLACITEPNRPDIDTKKFSVYGHDRLGYLWAEGNPFAWHLHLESRLLFSSDGVDFIASLGVPAAYKAGAEDCKKFARLFFDSFDQLSKTRVNATFNLSCMFLGIRNFATCYSLWRGHPVFSRRSPLLIDAPLSVDEEAFDVLARARVLSTRGIGDALSSEEVMLAIKVVPVIRAWMAQLLAEVIND
ncbi:hypothetical protein AVMA1855_17215 [Acidovorax sp. SUPP1855]|uniref:hypothetical protein n=1 Tax=Acidovorax sp. SUPP1855 TaxID=431774 RepID=UPI0023DE40EF|nr:hypothetical protein [Acidovorax sp. SUPP1855]GKS85917.1 hypothetical protein AVMA1855_17215 [Acidovorax sp. SUPP1855]